MCARCPLRSHSLQYDLTLLYGQIWFPLQSLHLDRCLSCGQIWLPLQSLQYDIRLWWWQIPLPLQSLHLAWSLPLVWADLTPFAVLAIRYPSLVMTNSTPFAVFTPCLISASRVGRSDSLYSLCTLISPSCADKFHFLWSLPFMDTFVFFRALRAGLIWNSSFFVDVKFV